MLLIRYLSINNLKKRQTRHSVSLPTGMSGSYPIPALPSANPTRNIQFNQLTPAFSTLPEFLSKKC